MFEAVEKVVGNQDKRVPLHPRRYAYKHGKSTETGLLELTEIIEKSA